MYLLLLGVVFFLAFSNGANDNFKGVATLRGSRHFSFWRAVAWATAWTAAGSVLSLWLAAKLLPVFSGAWLIHPEVNALSFVGAVGGGAALTVFLAVMVGMPISTTHALVGALTGVAVLAGGWATLESSVLATTAFLPLLLSPLAAMGLTWSTFPWLRRVFPVTRDCVCVTLPARLSPAMVTASGMTFPEMTQPNSNLLPTVTVDTSAACAVHSSGSQWRADWNEVIHWFSGGGISFSRGVNDTPKIAALLLAPGVGVSPWIAFGGVTLAMALGGMLGARRVAKTISEEITEIPPVEGTGANLATAALVSLASPLGLAVSTTHTSVGSIFGIALSQSRGTNWSKVRQIVFAWIVTVPAGALFGSVLYLLLS